MRIMTVIMAQRLAAFYSFLLLPNPASGACPVFRHTGMPGSVWGARFAQKSARCLHIFSTRLAINSQRLHVERKRAWTPPTVVTARVVSRRAKLLNVVFKTKRLAMLEARFRRCVALQEFA